MKIFTNKRLFKKLLCIIIAITIFSAVVPTNVSYAAGEFGGTLLKPIANLMLALADGAMEIIHSVVFGMPTSIIRVDTDIKFWEIVIVALAVIVTIVVIVYGGAILAGAGLKILSGIALKVIGTKVATTLGAAAIGALVVTGVKGGLIAGAYVQSTWFDNEVVFPMFKVTPEEIFKGQIPILDINFFKTQEDVNEQYKDTIEVDYGNYRKDIEDMEEIFTDTISVEIGFGDGWVDYIPNNKEEALEQLNKEIFELISAKAEYKDKNEKLPIDFQLDKLQQTGYWFVKENAYQIEIILDFKRVYDNDWNELSKWAWGEGSIYDDYENVYQIEYRFDISIKKGKWHWVEISKTAEKTDTIQDNNPYWDKHIYSTSAQDWGCEDFVSYVDFELTKMWEKMVTDYGYTRGKENLFVEWYIGPNGIPWKDLVGTHQTQSGNAGREGSWGPDSNINNVLGLPVNKQMHAGKFKIYTTLSYDATNDISTLDVKISDITYNETNVRVLTEEEIKKEIEEKEKVDTLGLGLKPTISKWYYGIRNFVLVIMMIILLYVGIRIMLCGVASEKAKYKNMLTDWVVAICLVFVMHYIMAFSMNIVESVTKIFGTVGNGEENYVHEYSTIYLYDTRIGGKIDKAFEKLGLNIYEYKDYTEDGKEILVWDTGNIVGMARIQAALSGEESESYLYIGYVMCYIVLVLFTIFFLFTYLKRALYLTFFTVIAPFVAMTYPIDKMHDGKAQAFNIWFKEYIFNLMIQPVHLVLYLLLISTAFELATENILYTLVAIGFMMPAEKFLRKMFGFDKAQTPGFLSGAAGTALLASGLSKLFGRRSTKGGKNGGYVDDGGASNKEDKINIKDDSSVNPFLLANGSGVQKEGKAPNVLLNQDKQNQEQNAEMAQIAQNSQALNLGAIDPYRTRKSNSVTPNISKDVKKQFDTPQNAAFRKAQYKAKQRADKREKNLELRKKRMAQLKTKLDKTRAQAKAYRKSWAGQTLRRTANNLANGNTIRKIANTVGGVYLGAAGAMFGATFALADDTPVKKLGQFVPTLAVGGYALGSKIANANYDEQLAYEEAQRAQYESEEEYRKYLLEEQRKAVTENEKKQRQLRTYLKLRDEEEAKQYMKKYGACIDAGITDMEDFATIVKLVEEKGWEPNMAITASKYYKKAGGKPKNMGKRDRENIEYQYESIARANGVPEGDVEETVKIMLKNLDIYGATKDNLTNV